MTEHTIVEIWNYKIIISFRKSEKEKKVTQAVVFTINRLSARNTKQNRKNHTGDFIKGEVGAGNFIYEEF